MSTKTTIKRIALVAAAALALGGFSAVSANASVPALNVTGDPTFVATGYYTVSPATGTYSQIILTGTTDHSVTISSTGSGAVYFPGSNPDGSVLSTSLGSSTALWYASLSNSVPGSYTFTGSSASSLTFSAYSATAGSQVITITGDVTGAQTITIAWGTAPQTVYAKTSVTNTPAYSTGTNTTFSYTDADGAKSVLASAANLLDPVAYVTVNQKDATGLNLLTGKTKVVTLQLAGVGTLSARDGGLPVAPYQYVAAKDPNAPQFAVFADGRAGTATLTVSVDGVAVKTLTYVFYGKAASYKTTVNKAWVQTGGLFDGTGMAVFTTTALDSNGTVVPNASFYVKSSDTLIAALTTANPSTYHSCIDSMNCTSTEWDALGSFDSDVNAGAKGKVTFTVTDAVVAPKITATADVQVSGAQAATATFTLDSSSYQTGQAGTLTVTLKDSDGNPVGDGPYAINDNATASKQIASNVLVLSANNSGAVLLPTSFTTTSGVKTYKFFAPTTPGDLTWSGTLGSGPALAAALRGSAVSVTASVSSAAVDAAGLAQDAANAATDAANNAYDEAQNATQAASDALAAVTALSAQVSALIASVKALAAVVAKIKAKVKA
jgi:hypothetical protein